MHISAPSDSGNIEVIDAADPANIRLAIRKDSNADYFLWFHFRAVGGRDVDCALVIENAGAASYTKGWERYRAVASYDRENWFRVPTEYDGGKLTIRHRPDRDSVYYAYFATYPLERCRDYSARTQRSDRVRLECLGRTLDGEDLDMLVIGDGNPGKRKCWVIGRQHPGETQASYWMEGFIDRLLDPADPVARAVLDKATLYVVPNMNPDGSRRGNLRVNAAGSNLNREWADPTMDKSPEVFLTRARMNETGVDFCLDVHGDEGLPYVFIAGSDGIPSLTQKQSDLRLAFDAALMRANPDYQTEHGYPKAPAGKGNLTMCTAHVAETFGCLAMTLEMPFKDNANAPDDEVGWSPDRCRRQGEGCLDALYAVVDELR
ncbi:MAG: carboxypeptidase family protein [Rhodospirillaceae bacterium]|nr:carboxypeptidase family protein [Rhodospirillaceae bacterium]